ncbi:laminin subunit beta-3 isoform X2 [Hoplias malabaricus]
MKCCPCDSRNPAGPNAHTIQDILPMAEPERWWQSRKDVSPVSLQLDLKQMFQVDNVMLSFKGPRPEALVIERTRDFGKTWQPALYMASECASTFPQVTMAKPRTLYHTYCYTLPTTTSNPYQDQRIYFHPLHQYSGINVPQEQKIEEVSGFTGLRVNLTQFGSVPHLPGRSPSRFYALKALKVTGTCFCHGHANRCLPDPTSNLLSTVQVNEMCECQHNTAGVNCQRCADLYNDLPWRPAQLHNTHTCKRCECNNHAERCHFDAAVFERSGRRSGGVCDGCLHHTIGSNCERCADNYYRNKLSSIQSTDACIPCECNSAGVVPGRPCDPVTGVCVCKSNVEGVGCDRCRPGFFGLNAVNPLGCSECSCSVTGSLHGVCDAVSGQCSCRPNYYGHSCDRCSPGFWNSPSGCEPCTCDPESSLSSTCDQWTGQCVCRSGSMGRTCSGCADGTYGDPLTSCKRCECDLLGTAPGGCDKQTGVCRCKAGVVGARCDACARGHCASFPQCPVCPSCFFSLDAQLQNLTLGLDFLLDRLDQTGPTTPGDLDDQIQNLENTLLQIRGSLTLPPRSDPLLNKGLDTLRTLRLFFMRVNSGLKAADPFPDLQGGLDTLETLLASIRLAYRNKNTTTSTGNSYAGVLAAIKKAYDRSEQAEKQANITGTTISQSASTRENAKKQVDSVQPENTKTLQKLREDLETRPNLTPTTLQVCGSNRVSPCTPAECVGEVCPAGETPTCEQIEHCTGALPQSLTAKQETEHVQNKLQQLSNNITHTYTQIQEVQDLANHVRLSTDELTNQIRQMRDDLDYDLQNVKDFVKKLKDFLSDPSSDPAQVQQVCEEVLGVGLHEGEESLRKKLQELQDLAMTLPDSSRVLQEAEPKLLQAQRLLQEAQKARNDSLRLQEDTDQLLEALIQSDDNIMDLEDKLKQSQDIINSVKDNVQQVEDLLSPVEQLVSEVPELLDSVRPLMEKLKNAVQRAGVQAEEAEKQAGGAQLEANLAAKELEALQDQLKKLKQNANASSGANAADQRVNVLQEDAAALVQETIHMMTTLTDRERSLQNSTDFLHKSSERLVGLDAQLQGLISDINKKATELMLCQG